jgi:hypothetical protein
MGKDKRDAIAAKKVPHTTQLPQAAPAALTQAEVDGLNTGDATRSSSTGWPGQVRVALLASGSSVDGRLGALQKGSAGSNPGGRAVGRVGSLGDVRHLRFKNPPAVRHGSRSISAGRFRGLPLAAASLKLRQNGGGAPYSGNH